mmetsp:Transcript_28887/g.61845  ORF Transcript_28887/g.61845 Transcript_28887/m.61845 type:complete len:119 (-) Transcript_28887:60-416(-)
MQLGMTPQTQGFLKDRTNHFFGHWFNTNQLQILSFRNSQGIVLNCATTADPQVLKPVTDGPVANCCPADVAFVQVLCKSITPTILRSSILRSPYPHSISSISSNTLRRHVRSPTPTEL